MITQIETALEAFITAQFAAASPVITAPVRAATGNVPMPEDRSVVVVLGGKPEHQGGGMYDVNVNCLVRSPSDVKGITPGSHAAIEAAVGEVFGVQDSDILAALSSAITAQFASHTCCGYHVVGWTPGREDTNWLPSFEVKIGLDPV